MKYIIDVAGGGRSYSLKSGESLSFKVKNSQKIAIKKTSLDDIAVINDLSIIKDNSDAVVYFSDGAHIRLENFYASQDNQLLIGDGSHLTFSSDNHTYANREVIFGANSDEAFTMAYNTLATNNPINFDNLSANHYAMADNIVVSDSVSHASSGISATSTLELGVFTLGGIAAAVGAGGRGSSDQHKGYRLAQETSLDGSGVGSVYSSYGKLYSFLGGIVTHQYNASGQEISSKLIASSGEIRSAKTEIDDEYQYNSSGNISKDIQTTTIGADVSKTLLVATSWDSHGNPLEVNVDFNNDGTIDAKVAFAREYDSHGNTIQIDSIMTDLNNTVLLSKVDKVKYTYDDKNNPISGNVSIEGTASVNGTATKFTGSFTAHYDYVYDTIAANYHHNFFI